MLKFARENISTIISYVLRKKMYLILNSNYHFVSVTVGRMLSNKQHLS